jgi:thiosulfate dehydrogenase [quinone] large subunit
MTSLTGLFSSASHFQVGYFLFRISLGVNIFFHGAMRLITGLGAWEQELAASFADNPLLPMWAVDAFLYALPFVEVVLGSLLTLGLYTHWAVIGGLLMMLTLIFGNTTQQAWATAGNNMHYSL